MSLAHLNTAVHVSMMLQSMTVRLIKCCARVLRLRVSGKRRDLVKRILLAHEDRPGRVFAVVRGAFLTAVVGHHPVRNLLCAFEKVASDAKEEAEGEDVEMTDAVY
jgi:hypothetical protein